MIYIIATDITEADLPESVVNIINEQVSIVHDVATLHKATLSWANRFRLTLAWNGALRMATPRDLQEGLDKSLLGLNGSKGLMEYFAGLDANALVTMGHLESISMLSPVARTCEALFTSLGFLRTALMSVEPAKGWLEELLELQLSWKRNQLRADAVLAEWQSPALIQTVNEFLESQQVGETIADDDTVELNVVDVIEQDSEEPETTSEKKKRKRKKRRGGKAISTTTVIPEPTFSTTISAAEISSTSTSTTTTSTTTTTRTTPATAVVPTPLADELFDNWTPVGEMSEDWIPVGKNGRSNKESKTTQGNRKRVVKTTSTTKRPSYSTTRTTQKTIVSTSASTTTTTSTSTTTSTATTTTTSTTTIPTTSTITTTSTASSTSTPVTSTLPATTVGPRLENLNPQAAPFIPPKLNPLYPIASDMEEITQSVIVSLGRLGSLVSSAGRVAPNEFSSAMVDQVAQRLRGVQFAMDSLRRAESDLVAIINNKPVLRPHPLTVDPRTVPGPLKTSIEYYPTL